MKPFLSICMIVKDEEKVLRRCLESIEGIADEIIIVDTGSSDKTKEIAFEFTRMVYDYKWENDFSKARNFAASKSSGEWILAIDADEFVDRASFSDFKRSLIESPPVNNILAVQIVNFVGNNGEETSLNYHERLYKNNGYISYYRSIHELLMHKESKENRGLTEFQIFHTGYMGNVVKEKDKSKRNLTLLKNKRDKEPIDYFFIGNEYDQLGDLDKAIRYYQKGYQLKEDVNQEWVKKLLLRLVNALHKAKRDDEALKIAESCINIYERLVDFRFIKGKISLDRDEIETAKNIFLNILMDTGSLVADTSQDYLEYLPHKYLAEIYEKENQLHLSVQHYTKALSINDSDDQLWMRLILLLAKHSNLEELTLFIYKNILSRKSMSLIRLIKILLSVPLDIVQKLTRIFLDDPQLLKSEKDALLLKNNFLDGELTVVSDMLVNKNLNEMVSLLSIGLFNIIDYTLYILDRNEENHREMLLNIKFDRPISNLFNVLFGKKNKKLSVFEEELFVSIIKQAYVLNLDNLVASLNNKKGQLSIEGKNKVKKELELLMIN